MKQCPRCHGVGGYWDKVAWTEDKEWVSCEDPWHSPKWRSALNPTSVVSHLVSRETARCGFKPALGWSELEGNKKCRKCLEVENHE